MGCYGSSFVRVLAGSGYAVRWPSENSFVFADVSAPLSTSLNAPSAESAGTFEMSRARYYGKKCRCRGSEDSAAKVADFLSHMNRSVQTIFSFLSDRIPVLILFLF